MDGTISAINKAKQLGSAAGIHGPVQAATLGVGTYAAARLFAPFNRLLGNVGDGIDAFSKAFAKSGEYAGTTLQTGVGLAAVPLTIGIGAAGFGGAVAITKRSGTMNLIRKLWPADAPDLPGTAGARTGSSGAKLPDADGAPGPGAAGEASEVAAEVAAEAGPPKSMFGPGSVGRKAAAAVAIGGGVAGASAGIALAIDGTRSAKGTKGGGAEDGDSAGGGELGAAAAAQQQQEVLQVVILLGVLAVVGVGGFLVLRKKG